MAEVVLGTVFGAMQIIYAAYRDIKSNRENCAALVRRAEIVVEGLKLLIVRQTQEAREESTAERIGALISAFEGTAQVIRQIGHKNWLRALLDADRDAIQVQHCHQCLTDLMFLFNIEQGLNQWNMQRENERVRKHDHRNLLQVAHSVQSELTAQGEVIGEVLDMVRTLSQSPTFNTPARGVSQDSVASCTRHGVTSVRGARFDRLESPKPQSITKMRIRKEGTKRGSNTVVRRASWMDKLGLQKTSAVRLSTSVKPPYMAKARRKSCSKVVVAKTPSTPELDAPKWKTRGSKVPSKVLSNDNSGGCFPERGRSPSRQFMISQAASLAAPLTQAPRARPSSRNPSTSPCSSKYLEVRYYSGNMASGILLSKACDSLGKTTIGELRRASSNPIHRSRLSRLNEGNFVMEIPEDVGLADILNVSPWDNQGPLSVVWVIGSYGVHLEPIGIFTTEESHFEWALVPCTTNTLVQDVTGVIGKLTNREIVGCFRRDERQTHRMNQSQLLRDCAVGRGMYLEVEISL